MLQFHSLVAIIILTALTTSCQTTTLTAVADFSQKGITGRITFTQFDSTSPTSITVDIQGLSPGQLYQWHVHQYQFTSALAVPCSPATVGGHFDPFNAALSPTYATDCNSSSIESCEIGDLSGKFGPLNSTQLPFRVNDSTLSIYGRNSIADRSVVIHHQNGSRFVCANILVRSHDVSHDASCDGTCDGTIIARQYAPFRNFEITGNVYFNEHDFNLTIVYANVSTPDSTQRHNWHVHQTAMRPNDSSCSSTGDHYNPFNVSTGGNYSNLCQPSSPLQCEVGDLSGKGGQLNFSSNRARLQYTDVYLPIIPNVEGQTIRNRSIVIHGANGGSSRIACADLTRLSPRRVAAVFNGDEGVTGEITLQQNSPFEFTKISVNISGLKGIAGGYHIHSMPIGEGVMGRNKCGEKYTGGHFNPRGASYPLPLNLTSDRYEVGDLSGKFGSLARSSHLDQVYYDFNVPLFGIDSVVGRSIVIHFADNASRWACANIEYVTPTIRARTAFTLYGHVVQLELIQPSDDQYADTVIILRTNVTTAQPSSTISTSFSPSLSLPSSSVMMLTSSSGIMSSFASSTTESPSLSSSSSDISTGSPSQSPSSSLSPSQSPSSSSLSPSQSPSSSSLSPSQTPSSSSLSPSQSPSSSSLSPSPSSSSLSPSPSSSSLSPSQSPSSVILSPSPSMFGSGMLRRRRSLYDEDDTSDFITTDEEDYYFEDHKLYKRQATDSISWSILDQPQEDDYSQPINCNLLSVSLQAPFENEGLCELGHQLACSGGDLTSKHGSLVISSSDGIRAVYTDPYLPLSGPQSIIGKLLHISSQEEGGQVDFVVPVQPDDGSLIDSPISCYTSPSSSSSSIVTSSVSVIPTTSAIPPPSMLPFSQTVLIIICASSGTLFLMILFLCICIIICCAARRKQTSHKYIVKDKLKKDVGRIEMGSYQKNKPVIGVATYRAIYDYTPSQNDDLALKEGDMVMLVEAPAGGDWWRGKVDDREGWFPKSYVNYIDMKKDSFAAAAATIRVASMAFTATPPTNKKIEKLTLENVDLESSFIIQGKPPAVLLDDRVLTPIEVMAVSGMEKATSPMEAMTKSTDNLAVISPSIDDEDIYVALYEYVPQNDSELRLVPGDRVVVIEQAEGGWWHGVIGEAHGWFPQSFVAKEVLPSAPSKEEKANAVENEVFQPQGMTEFNKGSSDEVEVSEYRAVYSFQSTTEGDLSFNEGDVILVYWANQNGWWFGQSTVTQLQGYFPGSYLEAVLDDKFPPPFSEKEEEEIEQEISRITEGGASSPMSDVASDQSESTPVADSPIVSSGAVSLSDQLAAAVMKRKSTPEVSKESEASSPPVEETPKVPESTGMTGSNLQNDIMNALSSLGKDKKTTDSQEPDKSKITGPATVPEPATITPEPVSTTKPIAGVGSVKDVKGSTRRKAPPPPASVKRNVVKSPSPLTVSTKSATPTQQGDKATPPKPTEDAPAKDDKATPSEDTSLKDEKTAPSKNDEATPPTRGDKTTPPDKSTPANDDKAATPPKLAVATPTKEEKASLAKEDESQARPSIVVTSSSDNTSQGASVSRRPSKPVGAPKVMKKLTASPRAKPRRAPPPPPAVPTQENISYGVVLPVPNALPVDDTSNTTDVKTPPVATIPIMNNAAPLTNTVTKGKQPNAPIVASVDNTVQPRAAPTERKNVGGWKPQSRKSKQASSASKPKVQMVKRPVRREIPPPPSIPLPPPPDKSKRITTPPAVAPPILPRQDEEVKVQPGTPQAPPRPRRDTSKKLNDYEMPQAITPPLSNTAKRTSHEYLTPILTSVPASSTRDSNNDISITKTSNNDTVTTSNIASTTGTTSSTTTSTDIATTTTSTTKTSVKASENTTNELAPSSSSTNAKISPKPQVKPKPVIATKPSIPKKPVPPPLKITDQPAKAASNAAVPSIRPRLPKPAPPTRGSSLPSTPQGSPSSSPATSPRNNPQPVARTIQSTPSPSLSPSPLAQDTAQSVTTRQAPPPRPRAPPSTSKKTETSKSPVENKTEQPIPRTEKAIPKAVPRTEKAVPRTEKAVPRTEKAVPGTEKAVEQPLPKARRRSSDQGIPSRPPPPVTRRLSKPQVTPEHYKVIKGYSARGDGELSISIGDTVVIMNDKSNMNGLVHGMLDDGTTGLFPLSHVEKVKK